MQYNLDVNEVLIIGLGHEFFKIESWMIVDRKNRKQGLVFEMTKLYHNF